nr:hypothetical protein [Lysobacter enzymogenes]
MASASRAGQVPLRARQFGANGHLRRAREFVVTPVQFVQAFARQPHRFGVARLGVEQGQPGDGDEAVAVVFRAERALRLFGQRLGAAVVAEHGVAARQRRQAARAQAGLLVQRHRAQFAFGALQQRARREGRAAQARLGRAAQGRGEQAGDALAGAHLALDALVLPDDRAGAGQHHHGQRGEHGAGGGCAGAICAAFAPAAAAHADRTMLAPGAQIAGELGDARVAVLRPRRHRLERDRGEVAGERAAQRVGRVEAALARERVVVVADQPVHRFGLAGGGDRHQFAQAVQTARPVPAQQSVAQHAEHVQVGGRALGAVLARFRRGVVGGDRQVRAGIAVGGAVETGGDAEVEQLHAAVGGHQQVGRLDVAVQHALRVRIGERVAGLQQQVGARVQAEPAALAPGVDRFALDPAQGEPRPAVGVDAAVDDAGDAGMVQAREQIAFLAERRGQLGRFQPGADALDRHALLELAVVAACFVDRAHAAAAEDALDPPRAEQAADAAVRLVFVVLGGLVGPRLAFGDDLRRRAVEHAGVGFVASEQRA